MRKCDVCKEMFDMDKDNWKHVKGFESSVEHPVLGYNYPNLFICSKCKCLCSSKIKCYNGRTT